MSPRKIHADQADLDEPLVRELIASQFPQWAALPLRPFDSGGTVNAIYRLGSELSVRLPLRPAVTGDAQREQGKLARVAPYLPVAIPTVEGIGTPTDAYPGEWSVHRWLTGAHPVPDALADPRGLASDLAALIDAFRRIDPAGGPPAYRGGPLGAMDESTRNGIRLLDGMIDTAAALAVWEETLAAPYDGREVWVHSDLMPSNLLGSDEGRLAAVIDFETCGVGDPACDLFVVWNLLPASVRDDFRSALSIDDATWVRGRGRVLSQALIALPYYQDTNPAFAAYSRHVIREVLTDAARR